MRIFDADLHWIETEAELLQIAGLKRNRIMPRDAWDRTLGGQFPEVKPSLEEYMSFLDNNKIKEAVVHPTRSLSLGMIPEIDLAVKTADAYNSYSLEQVKKWKGSTVLHPIALAVPQKISHTVNMIEEYKKAGFVGILLLPHGHEKLLGDEEFFELYQKCEELDMPITIHPNSFGAIGTKGFKTFAEVHCVSFPFELIKQFVSMVLSGVFEKFPKLHVAFLEAGVGWMPYWISRLDEEFTLRKNELSLKNKPSMTLKSSKVFVSCNGYEKELIEVNSLLGGGVIWQSDYPHWDHVGLETVEDLQSHLNQELLEKILWKNAINCYKLNVGIEERVF
ncbi:amidohydrolase family protein [Bacillus thuringiensis]|uniref:amidohydrolase family protein n=1 Tax=Bacillus thuringiensis TaxID=1428 RepID=UPI0011A6973E|nr:amidohydrolase family protein [Bacillus thuringiensis]